MISPFHRCLMIAGGHVANLVSFGMSLSFGLLYSELRDQFNMRRSQAAWIASLFNGLLAISGVVFGFLVPIFGERKVGIASTLIGTVGIVTSMLATDYKMLYLTYGVVAGIGAGGLHFSSFTFIAKTFTEGRAVAVSIVSCGAAVGNLGLNPLISICLEQFGWRGTFLILGAITLHGLPASLPLANSDIKDVPTEHKSVTKKIGESVVTTLTDCRYLLITLAIAFSFGSVFVPITFLQDLLKEEGSLSEDSLYTAGMVLGVGSLVGRLSIGFIARSICLDTLTILYSILVLFAACAMMPFWIMHPFVLASTTGVSSGAFLSIGLTAAAEVIDSIDTNFDVAFGIFTAIAGLVAVGTLPLAGLFSDSYGTHKAAFLFSGSLVLFSAVCTFVVKLLSKRKEGVSKTCADDDPFENTHL